MRELTQKSASCSRYLVHRCSEVNTVCVYYNVYIFSPDAVMDLTMLSNGSNSSQHFALSCITGERNTDGLELSIRKDNSIMRMIKTPHFTVQQLHSRKVLASGFSEMDHKGIFYCYLKQGSIHQTNVTLISNYNKGECLHRIVRKPGKQRKRRCYIWSYFFIFSKLNSDHRGSPM